MTAVNLSDLDRHVREFHERGRHAEDLISELDTVLSLDAESPLRQSTYALIGGYRNALDAAFHIGGWLDWWWLECGFGNNPLQASPAGGQLRLIETVDDLVALVAEDIG